MRGGNIASAVPGNLYALPKQCQGRPGLLSTPESRGSDRYRYGKWYASHHQRDGDDQPEPAYISRWRASLPHP